MNSAANTLFDFQEDKALTEKMHAKSPYCATLGLCAGTSIANGNERLFYLPFQKAQIGNTLLPALHGGMMAGFMTVSAEYFLQALIGSENIPKLIDFSLDYLRSGQAEDSYAHVKLTRRGRRVSRMDVTMFQSDATKPIAIGRMHFLMPKQ